MTNPGNKQIIAVTKSVITQVISYCFPIVTFYFSTFFVISISQSYVFSPFHISKIVIIAMLYPHDLPMLLFLSHKRILLPTLIKVGTTGTNLLVSVKNPSLLITSTLLLTGALTQLFSLTNLTW